MKTIGIFPASGALGTSTYTHLLKLVPNERVILINRHPEKVAQQYVEAGVNVRQASYESAPEELEAAFTGVEVLFLISYPSHVHEYRVNVSFPDTAPTAEERTWRNPKGERADTPTAGPDPRHRRRPPRRRQAHLLQQPGLRLRPRRRPPHQGLLPGGGDAGAP
jgi:hypothetical protein